jgi:hypothetical protein
MISGNLSTVVEKPFIQEAPSITVTGFEDFQRVALTAWLINPLAEQL